MTPYLALTSPEKRSGKTRLLEVLELVVARPWRVVTPSEAVLFRKVAADIPTLLLDETDAVFRDRGPTYEGLRALLNAGNRRGVTVPRCVGEGRQQRIEEFPVFCPKALAGIGELPDTVADRCILIRLARRAPHEKVEAFRVREAVELARPLHHELATWGAVAAVILRESRPEVPDGLHDRAADAWEPLLAIADLAGAEWPTLAREAAVALHADPLAQEETEGVALLRAIRNTYGGFKVDRLATAELLKALVDREAEPWGEWWGRQVEAGDCRGPGRRLSDRLKRFGVQSRDLRMEDGTVRKGYLLADLEDAFLRYLPSLPPESQTTQQRDNAAMTRAAVNTTPPGDATQRYNATAEGA